MPKRLLCLAAACGLCLAQYTDHPAISAYPESKMDTSREQEFEEYLLQWPKADGSLVDKKLAGKVRRMRYRNPAGRSSTEIYSNYETALKKAGARVLYSCTGLGCRNWPTPKEQRMVGMPVAATTFGLVVQFQHQKAEMHAVLFVGNAYSWIHVIESKAMDSGLVSVDAAAMEEGVDRDGHINLYGINFDTGKATLRPDSKAAMDEILKLMRKRMTLKLHIVGHTDSTGSLASNLKLSADRSRTVTETLVKEGIAADRLQAHGVGPLAPVASNATEEGRAKNRRVDLVVQ